MKLDIKIDKNVPLPRSWRVQKYPWHQMKEGESFFTTLDTQTLRSALSYAVRRKGGSFTTRRVVENETPGIRVWCIEPMNGSPAPRISSSHPSPPPPQLPP